MQRQEAGKEVLTLILKPRKLWIREPYPLVSRWRALVSFLAMTDERGEQIFADWLGAHSVQPGRRSRSTRSQHRRKMSFNRENIIITISALQYRSVISSLRSGPGEIGLHAISNPTSCYRST